MQKLGKQSEIKSSSKEDLFKELSKRHQNNPFATLSSFPNPKLLKDNEKASHRIKKAIENKEKIVLVGDYDVDGVSSSAIMLDFFSQIPYPLTCKIPDRFKHGYGLSPKLLDEIDSDTKLVITVDNGINAFESAKILKERNIDLIITDHHNPEDTLPQASAVINPKQKDCTFPFKDICGAVVAWYFCSCIKSVLELNTNMSKYLDILALASIADVMPMLGLNHTLVKAGLRVMSKREKEPFKVIAEEKQIQDFGYEDIGFFLAPLINSAGRLAHASLSLDFLRAKTPKLASKNFELLSALNEERKDLQLQVLAEARVQVNKEDAILVLFGSSWHEGVLGIVASKICEEFKRPCIILSIENEKAKGSARSNGDFILYDLLFLSKQYLTSFGGHANAAGLTLEAKNIIPFKESLNDNLKKMNKCLYLEKEIFAKLKLEDIDFELYDIIKSFEPYGLQNPKPIFLLENIKAYNYSLLGKEKNHLKILLEHNGNFLEALFFNFKIKDTQNLNILKNNIDIVFTLSLNTFRNQSKINLLISSLEASKAPNQN